jgi:hypothetical protein
LSRYPSQLSFRHGFFFFARGLGIEISPDSRIQRMAEDALEQREDGDEMEEEEDDIEETLDLVSHTFATLDQFLHVGGRSHSNLLGRRMGTYILIHSFLSFLYLEYDSMLFF